MRLQYLELKLQRMQDAYETGAMVEGVVEEVALQTGLQRLEVEKASIRCQVTKKGR